jgi:hypothetical protein
MLKFVTRFQQAKQIVEIMELVVVKDFISKIKWMQQ